MNNYSGIKLVWYNMIRRCKGKAGDRVNKHYHGRGIKVCPQWEDYEAFRSWALSSGYVAGLEIDRRDNNGNYEPDNCRWVTRQQNVTNRRSCRGTSRHKGVSWCESRKKWQVHIAINGVSTSLGRYADEDEAAKVYDQKAREVYGEYAMTNYQ